jgi:hypothetical protein
LQFCNLEVGFLEIDQQQQQQQQQLQEWSSLSEVILEISWSSVKFFEKIFHWRRIMGCEETIAIRILNPLFSFFVGCDLSMETRHWAAIKKAATVKEENQNERGKRRREKRGRV